MAEQDKGENSSQNMTVKIEKLQVQLREKELTIQDLNRSLKEIKSKLFESQKKSK